jgi:hypothetical protein
MAAFFNRATAGAAVLLVVLAASVLVRGAEWSDAMGLNFEDARLAPKDAEHPIWDSTCRVTTYMLRGREAIGHFYGGGC